MAKIEWTDITVNPIKGKCPTACPYCYARAMYDDNHWDPSIRFMPEVLDNLPKKPCRVFVGSTIDLFLFPDWMAAILERFRRYPDHTFILLTKKPEELHKYSPFPDNCHVGVSATHGLMLDHACEALMNIEAPVKFVSIEPFIGSFESLTRHWFINAGINWVIIGAMTGRKNKLLEMQKHYYYARLNLQKLDDTGRKYVLLPPSIDHVRNVVTAADEAGARVFLKDNLEPLLKDAIMALNRDLYWRDGYYTAPEHPDIDLHLRQELPDRRAKE
jgi:protein gp37